jgi:hypothetical protein
VSEGAVVLSRGEAEAAKAVSTYLGSIQPPKGAGAGSGGSGDKSSTPAPATLAGSGDTSTISTPGGVAKGKGEESRRIREAMSEARDPLSEGALVEMVRKIAEQHKKEGRS